MSYLFKSFTSLLGRIVHGFMPFIGSIVGKRDHFAPHSGVGFEGYYSRTQLDNGGTLAIIFCWVKDAPKRANLLHVSYTPPDPTSSPLAEFKYEFFPDVRHIDIIAETADGQQSFVVTMPNLGVMKVFPKLVEYDIHIADVSLHINLKLEDPIAWIPSRPLEGPMGPLTYLSPLLPLNWHVYCTSSVASCTISCFGYTFKATGTSHLEKNWGVSFPKGWIWSQSFSVGNEQKSLCLAGGAALPGIQAYLVGYRSKNIHWDFRPPFAMAFSFISPFMHVNHNSKEGAVSLTVQTFCRKLFIKLEAPPGSFMGIAAPLKGGHRPMVAFESFKGRTYVQAWSRRWPWQSWTLVEQNVCGISSDNIACSALEFGGSYCHLVQDADKKSC